MPQKETYNTSYLTQRKTVERPRGKQSSNQTVYTYMHSKPKKDSAIVVSRWNTSNTKEDKGIFFFQPS